MTPEEYKQQKRKLEENHRIALKQLAIEYASSNNPYKIGDVLTSDFGSTIKVDKITVFMGYHYDLPECSYEGVEYTKKGEPNKRGTRSSFLQSRIKTK